MKLPLRIAYLFRRGRLERELADEMEFHRAAHQQRLERDGLSPREAAAASRRAMGNVTLAREDARGVWLAPWFESVWQDFAYAVRALWRQPGFSVLAIGALTAGIGLNVSLYTVYTAMTMKPWAVREPDRVVRVISTSAYDLRKRAGGAPGGFSRAETEFFAANARTFTGFTILGRGVSVALGNTDVSAYWVGGNYFSLLGAEMAAGRGFTAGEDALDSPQAVAVVSHGFWQRQLGGDPAAIGQQIRLDGVPFSVVGVASPRFLGTATQRVDIWMPLASSALLRPQDRWVKSVGLQPANCCAPVAARLAPGATLAQAKAELEVLNRRFRGERGGDQGGLRLAGTQVLEPGRGDASGTFMPLFVGLLLVMLLACANVGNLLLARGAARRREIAVRLSLGASRFRLIRQLLVESFVISAIAGVAGILVAAWLPSRMLALTSGTPMALRLEPDTGALLFTLAISTVACLLSGLAPALRATRRDAIGALKEGSALPGARFTLRTLLLSVQVAAVVILLVAAGVMVRSAERAGERALAGAARGVSAITVQAPVRGYDPARTRAVSRQMLEQLERAAPPGALVLTSTPPLGSGNIKGGFRLPGSAEDQWNAIFEVTPAYFAMMGITIREGRGFEAADAGRPVIVVNETLAKQHWPGQSAVGQRILCTPPESGWNMPGELEIVGVVQDSLLTEIDEVQPTIFQPPSHRAIPHALVIGPAAVDGVVAAIARIDPDLRVRVQSLEAGLEPRLRSARVGAMMAGTLGSIALGFAWVGMFGVFAFWVRQRTQEIGVRMALGAQSSDVIRLVLGTTVRAVAIGLAVGLAASAAGSRLLRSFLFGLSGIDLVTYVVVALILVVASLLAAYLPARRATRIDPLVALRYD